MRLPLQFDGIQDQKKVSAETLCLFTPDLIEDFSLVVFFQKFVALGIHI